MNKRIYTILFFLVHCFCELYSSHIVTQLNKPGLFQLGMDLECDPTFTGDCIILVNTSDIIIDLNQNTLSQVNGNFVPGFNAITINPGCSNVTILNGTIGEVTGIGIYVSDGCSDIYINDLTVKNCNNAGILFDGILTGTGISGGSIRHSSILTCTGVDGSAAFGLHMIKCKTMIINDVFFSGHDALTTSSGYGISCEYCQAIELSDCKIAATGGNDLAVGIYLMESNNILLKNCLTFGTVARSAQATARSYGILAQGCQHIWLNGSTSVSNYNLEAGGVGFALHNGARNLIENSFAQSNVGYSYGAGFELYNETESYVTNCKTRGNKAYATGSGYGIYLKDTCTRCYIEDNSLVNNGGVAASYGIMDESPISTNLVLSNYAFNNGINYNVTYTTDVVLPVLEGFLSTKPGIPTSAVGLNNISIYP